MKASRKSCKQWREGGNTGGGNTGGERERELASSWSLVHFVVCVVYRQRENCWKVGSKGGFFS
jgi:hypothetical protein